MIFISYGHDDHEEFIKLLARKLSDVGYEIWIDYNKLDGGSEWEERIEEGIKNSNWIVVFMTQHAMRRPDGYCLDEISFARFLNKPILPIKLQEIAPPISIARIQWIDMSGCLKHGEEYNEEYVNAKFKELMDILDGVKQLEYNSDSQYHLMHCFNPLDNESYLVSNKKFYGREWLFDQYEKWLEDTDKKSRVFAIIGQAGSGKTTFVTRLCERSSNVVAIHFCRYNNDERANPKRAIMSLAYHLSTQIPEYRAYLQRLPDIDKLQNKSISRLFEYLFIEPMNQITPPKEKNVLVIDALDEATKNMKNELVDLIVRDFHKTPSWLNLVVTSRPEQDIARKLKHLNPVVIVNDSEANLADIRGYLEKNLEPYIPEGADEDKIIETILTKSQGNFLYAAKIVGDIENETLSIDKVDEFPDGLVNVYTSYFERLFVLDDKYEYKREIRPLMEILCSCYEPLKEDVITEILDIDQYDFEEISEHIFVLFPTNNGLMEPLHKSLVDWLVDKELSGRFSVSLRAAHTRMSEYYYGKYQRGKHSNYMIKYLAKHLIASKNPELAVEPLTDAKLQEARIELIGQDSAIREYLIEIQALKDVDPSLAIDVLRSACFREIFRENRRYLYNAGLYFTLKDIGFDDIIEEYIAEKSIDILVGCVNYLYIVERYEDSVKLALRLVKEYDASEYYDLLSEIENEIALSYRKVVNFDEALVHCEKVCRLSASNKDYYEAALAHQTIGKIYYHRQMWEEAYFELCTAVRLLEESLPLTSDVDYTKMLKLYVAAFEREVALSLVWQKRTELANAHLAHAGEIYDAVHSTDRYYVRYLYVGMFADIVDGDYESAKEKYPEICGVMKSKYDKSQVELYYALGLYASGDTGAALEHVNTAYGYAKEIDAYLERNEIILLRNILLGESDDTAGMVGYGTNRDITEWIDFVRGFIRSLKENENEV